MGLFSRPRKNMAPKAKAAATSRNPLLTKGVGRYSRTAMYTRSGRYAIKNKKITKKAEAAPAIKEKTIGGKQNGGKRTIAPKASRFYPADDVPRKLANSKRAKPTKIRASITPGTVLILLAGRFRGKRVVFLKQLDISGVTVDGKFNDAYFRRPVKVAKKKTEDEFFASEESKPELSAERKEDQKKVDSALLAIVKKTDSMKAYLNARFSLTNGMAPHELVF